MFVKYFSDILKTGGGTTGAGAIIAKAARQVSEAQSFTTVNRSEIFYIDAGVWSGGTDGKAQTPFVLVSENNILLCSWLNLAEGGKVPPPDNAFEFPLDGSSFRMAVKLTGKAKDFLSMAAKIRRAHLLAVAFAEDPLTPPDELLLVVGDLHLNVYIDTWLDRFRHKDLYGTNELFSLDNELRKLLDLAAQCKAKTIQVGDFYDVWLSEIMLRMEYMYLDRFFSQRSNVNISAEQWQYYRRLLVDGKMVALLTGFDPEYDIPLMVPRDELYDAWSIDFRNTDAICEAIRKSHANLFQGHKRLFDYEIAGNHDNRMENCWWSSNDAPGDYRIHNVLSQNTKGGVPGVMFLHNEIGTGEHPIHIEHGHFYDTDNSNRDWWKPGKGFGIVFLAYASDFISRLAMRSNHQDWALKTADDAAKFYHFEMRLYGLRRADELFKNKDIRLVVLGHTHEPTLIASPVRLELGPLYDGWDSYKQGDNWWKSDKELQQERLEARARAKAK
jgi:hypothetical protein